MVTSSLPFDSIDLNALHRFEDILASENIIPNINISGLYSTGQSINFNIEIKIFGTDGITVFKTTYSKITTTTYPVAINDFLEWYDREVVRFNTYNQLT